MSTPIKQQDLDTFFGFLHAPERTPQSLVRAYVAFHGDLNWGQQEVFFHALRDAMGPEAAPRQRIDFLGADGELHRHVLQSVVPELADGYFTPEMPQAEVLQVLPESPNQWHDRTLPDPLNIRLKASIRPPFMILKTACRTMFASCYGYLSYDAERGVCWPALSSRAFDRSVDRYPRVPLDRPLVVAMDQFDGGNFAHFLFDTVSRVLHFQLHCPEEAARSVFLLGGEPGPLQRLTLRLIADRTGLLEEQFMFLDRRVVLETRQPMYFFSDQKWTVLHPLQMCHPASVRLVRDLFNALRLAPEEPTRLYISRGDAGMRRITNEPALCKALQRLGYTAVQLSEHDIVRQLALLAHARSVVAPHGMGLSFLLFQQGMAAVTELFHPTTGSDAYAFVSRALGLDYRFVVGEDAADHRVGYSVPVEQVAAMQAGT